MADMKALKHKLEVSQIKPVGVILELAGIIQLLWLPVDDQACRISLNGVSRGIASGYFYNYFKEVGPQSPLLYSFNIKANIANLKLDIFKSLSGIDFCLFFIRSQILLTLKQRLNKAH